MATITIRNLPDDLLERIKAKAAATGRSVQDEVRNHLQQHYSHGAEILDNRSTQIRQPATLSVANSRKTANLDADAALNASVEETDRHRK
ncbi:hypothetical protein SAMN05660831_01355 [Thiohalospira halophila DSM 15071]|uniref:Antitoxin FitA-like ribbon-helix-helix domain-containing protein n=1 Tax=Thiohalospira halophila DSM 15071 TaxID=1123397 RepID=A0A1I1QXI0_9GAMM|nr:hypothetical protein [Thiohalospira halophila]SFD26806.1 hypothetical protein SAMN05660831_01355 [Thiohalospira halophila DSM 15071]